MMLQFLELHCCGTPDILLCDKLVNLLMTNRDFLRATSYNFNNTHTDIKVKHALTADSETIQ